MKCTETEITDKENRNRVTYINKESHGDHFSVLQSLYITFTWKYYVKSLIYFLT